MLSLRERKQGHQGTAAIPRIGEVVLIKENLPRGRWKMGKIVELLVGKDRSQVS